MCSCACGTLAPPPWLAAAMAAAATEAGATIAPEQGRLVLAIARTWARAHSLAAATAQQYGVAIRVALAEPRRALRGPGTSGQGSFGAPAALRLAGAPLMAVAGPRVATGGVELGSAVARRRAGAQLAHRHCTAGFYGCACSSPDASAPRPCCRGAANRGGHASKCSTRARRGNRRSPTHHLAAPGTVRRVTGQQQRRSLNSQTLPATRISTKKPRDVKPQVVRATHKSRCQRAIRDRGGPVRRQNQERTLWLAPVSPTFGLS